MKLALLVLILTFMSISDTSAVKTTIQCARCDDDWVGGKWVPSPTCRPTQNAGTTCGGDVGFPVGFCRTEFSEDNVAVERHCADPANFEFQEIKPGCYRAKFNERWQNKTVSKKTCFCDTDNCNKVTVYDGV